MHVVIARKVGRIKGVRRKLFSPLNPMTRTAMRIGGYSSRSTVIASVVIQLNLSVSPLPIIQLKPQKKEKTDYIMKPSMKSHQFFFSTSTQSLVLTWYQLVPLVT